MRNTILSLITAVGGTSLVTMPAAASDRTDVVATVKQYAEAITKVDKDAFQKLCAPQASIIDDGPPYIFQGSAACTEWWDAIHALDKQVGISEESLTIGELKRAVVTGDRAVVSQFEIPPARRIGLDRLRYRDAKMAV
jgi:hypothetical protein